MLDHRSRAAAKNSHPWEARSAPVFIAIGTLVAVVVLLELFGAPTWLAVGIALLGGIVVALILVKWEHERVRLANSAQRENREELQAWKDRWELLHAETRQNASVLFQMTDGVAVLAPDCSILLINPAARRLLDVSRQGKLLGRSFPEVVRNPDIVTAVRDALARQRAQEVLVEIGDGTVVRPLRVRVERIETAAEGNLQLTIHDETEARRVDEIRREFIANVSHELKTPLAAIKGYAETVELAIEDDPQAAAHFMKQINSQCVRLERLVADMMQLARAQSGPTNLRLAELNLADVISESFKSYLPVAHSREIDLTMESNGCDATVMADREATLTIANNLIGNAIRYTPEGGNVRVGVRHEGDFWALTVSDDGIGISETEQQRIFERFYRVDRTRESASSGTGLGLSIVKNLASAQGGQVRLHSHPGKGSTFEVWLPAPVPAKATTP